MPDVRSRHQPNTRAASRSVPAGRVSPARNILPQRILVRDPGRWLPRIAAAEAGFNYDPPSLARLQTCAPLLQRKVLAAMETLANDKIWFRVAQGLRTAAEQEALYAQGRTAPGRIVTNAHAGYSNHNYGCAVDCYPFLAGQSGELNWHPQAPQFAAMVAALKAQGLVWGGDWRSIPDAPHFQLAQVPVTPTDADRALLAAGGLAAFWAHYRLL